MGISARWLAVAAVGSLVAVSSAAAQQPTRVRGTIAQVSGSTLIVRTDAGEFKVHLADGAKVIRVYVDGSADELKPGANVATFAVNKPDGTPETARINVGRNGVVPQ